MLWAFAEQLKACRQIASWSRAALRQIAAARRRREHDARWDSWEQTIRVLGQQACWHMRALQMGICHPDLFRFMLQVQEVSGGFELFLHQLTVEPKEVWPMEPDETIPIGKHVLPPLPYPYNALEPYIDERTMHLHHDIHHLSYVNGLNKAEEMMAKARATGDYDLIKHWEREAAFHGAGHYLHTIFWTVMTPGGGGEPASPLADELRRTFGSLQEFKAHFSAAAEKVEGVGWAILVWAPRPRRVEILQAERHQLLSQWDVVPLLPLDVWEHAYYLKYQTERRRYIDAWWNVVNWPTVSGRFEKARTLRWPPA